MLKKLYGEIKERDLDSAINNVMKIDTDSFLENSHPVD